METLNQEKLNPWISIWTKPRATIQQIVDSNPTHLVLLLAALGGISHVLDRASLKNMGDAIPVWTIITIALIGGPIGGIIGLYISGFLISYTGKWIGGLGSTQNIRAAMAWSNVPLVMILWLWLPQLGFFGNEMFTSATPVLAESVLLSVLMVCFGLIEITVGIWAIVIFFKCLGQVQGFSAWKALGNVFMAGAIIFVPIILFGVLVAVLIPMVMR